jgi:hypothetical protein
MKILRVSCPLCDWTHDEPDVESVIQPGMMRAFSDPDGLSDILKAQRMERIDAAVLAHMAKAHPDKDNDVIVRGPKL